jgi:hypothetical protein
LAQATPQQREKYELSPFGIHWEALDEDLSFEGFFAFQKENKKPRCNASGFCFFNTF